MLVCATISIIFFDDLRNAYGWSHLDSIITHPAGSRLQRVDINIKYYIWDDLHDERMKIHETEVSEPILDALPSLCEKGILFIEATERS